MPSWSDPEHSYAREHNLYCFIALTQNNNFGKFDNYLTTRVLPSTSLYQAPELATQTLIFQWISSDN